MALVFDGLPQGDNDERVARICENYLNFPIDNIFDKQSAIQKIESEQTLDLQVVNYRRDLQNQAKNFILANM